MSATDSEPGPGRRRRAAAADPHLGAANFLHPGKRIKLAPTDWYALGTHRGGIDERWFASTTEAANEGRAPDEGLSYCVFEGERFLLKDAVEEAGRGSSARQSGKNTNAGRSTRSSSTTWAPSRITCTSRPSTPR